MIVCVAIVFHCILKGIYTPMQATPELADGGVNWLDYNILPLALFPCMIYILHVYQAPPKSHLEFLEQPLKWELGCII